MQGSHFEGKSYFFFRLADQKQREDQKMIKNSKLPNLKAPKLPRPTSKQKWWIYKLIRELRGINKYILKLIKFF